MPGTATANQIRVLVVDDSMFIRVAIKRMLEADPEIVVIGMAADGSKAIAQIKSLQPDVVTMDIEMPRMDGLTALRQIMTENPLPVIMISKLTESGASATIEALSLGALDYISKQVAQSCVDILHIQQELHRKIKAVAKCRQKAIPKPSSFSKHETLQRSLSTTPLKFPHGARPDTIASASDIRVVAIGTSTGGPKALQEIIPLISPDFPAGILVVQHMPPFFTKSLATRLNSLSQLTVKEAETREIVEPGKVLIAPGGQHMTVIKRAGKYIIRLSESPVDCHHIPSVDVMMLSVAEAYGHHATGVILTGMGNDGAEGLTAIYNQGGITFAQDEATSVIYGMPRACAERGIVDQILPITRVADTLTHLVQKVKQPAD